MTAAQRLVIWENVLNRLQQKPTMGKMCICVCLHRAQQLSGIFDKFLLSDYPELVRHKPPHLAKNFDPSEPWWSLDPSGLRKRIEVVKQIIESL